MYGAAGQPLSTYSGGCTWYAFAVGLHTVLACWRSDHCGNSASAFSNNASGTVMPGFSSTNARLDRDACVLRAGAVQMMQNPGRSTALGKSSMRREPSLGAAPPSPVSQAVQRGGAALRAVRAHRDDESKIKEEGMDPAP